jgi:hypothetical protein
MGTTEGWAMSELPGASFLPKCNACGYPTAAGIALRDQIYCRDCFADLPPALDPVNHPPHYTSHPSGIECITITEHMGFCIGNAVKYLWRADLKGNAIEDLEKAEFYIRREIAKRKAGE